MHMPPLPGTAGQNRHRKWCRFSRSFGAWYWKTEKWRGSNGAVSRRIHPPFARGVPPFKENQERRPEFAADLPAKPQTQRQELFLALG